MPAASPRLRRGLLAFVFTFLLALIAVPATAGAYVNWSSGYGLGRASLDGSNPNRSFVPAGNVQSIARDGDYLYYVTGNSERGISRVNVDGTNAIPDFIPLATPWLSGIAVDDQHIYWTNAETGNIGRANIDGSGVDHTFITGGTFPFDVTVDDNYVYWSNYGTTTIGRAGLDGTGVNQSFINSGLYTTGVAVNGTHILWGRIDQSSIGRASLDGTGIDYGFIQTQAGGVQALAVDAGHVYWTKSNAMKIGRADLDGTGVNHDFIAADSNPGGIVVGPDTEPPNLSIDSGPNGPTGDTTPTFGFTAGADATSVSCSVDTGSASFGPCSGPASHTPSAPLAQGSYTFRVRAADSLSNEITKTRSFVVETLPPDTTIDSGPTGLTNDRNPSFGFSSSEAGSTFECRLDGGDWESCSSEARYELLDDGNHTFAARAIDPAGNTDPTPATRSFTVDTVLAEMSIDSGPPELTNQAVATFTFSSPEADATFECALNSFDFAPCSSPVSYNDLGDSSFRFLVRAIDAAGNFDPDHAWGYEFTVDRTAPGVVIDLGPSGPTPDSTPTFGFQVDEDDRVECSIDKGTPAFGPCSGPDTHTPSAALAAGSYTFRVRAWDEAGNNTTRTRAFSVAAPVTGTNCDAEAMVLATAQVKASEAEAARSLAAEKAKKAKAAVKKAKARLKRAEGAAEKKKAEAGLKKAKQKSKAAEENLRKADEFLDNADIDVEMAQAALTACRSA